MELPDSLLSKLSHYSILLSHHDQSIKIRHKLNATGKTEIGSIILFIGGLFLLLISINKIFTIVGIVVFFLGLLVSSAGFLNIYSILTDFLELKEDILTFKCLSRYRSKHSLKPSDIFITKSYIKEIRRKQITNKFRVVEIFLVSANKKIRVMNFSDKEENHEKVVEVGIELKNFLNQNISYMNR